MLEIIIAVLLILLAGFEFGEATRCLLDKKYFSSGVRYTLWVGLMAILISMIFGL